MPIDREKTVAIKVYLPRATYETLSAIARQEGGSLSLLMAQAAIEKYLLRGKLRTYREPCDSNKSHKTVKAPEMPVEPSIEPKEPKRSETPKTFYKLSMMLISTKETLDLDRLCERLEPDSKKRRSLKARMCQLGGRGDLLFQGSLTHAETVEAKTASLDPEGKPWFPLAANRLQWSQMTAKDFVALCMAEKPSENGL